MGILRPTINTKPFKNVSLGFEQHIYQNDRFLKGTPRLHLTHIKQKLFLQWYFEDKDRNETKYH